MKLEITLLAERPTSTERWCAVYGAIISAYIIENTKVIKDLSEADMRWMITQAERMADLEHGVRRLMEVEKIPIKYADQL